MQINKSTISINAPASKVWDAISKAEEMCKWIPSSVIEGGGTLGSEILMKFYNADGTPWEVSGKPYELRARLDRMVPEKLLEYNHEGREGMFTESMILEAENAETTSMTIQQEVNQHADGWKNGAVQTLKLLKAYLEKN
ncbi:MAG: SRPBCC domain-containing protein [Bacteroidota bacterium]